MQVGHCLFHDTGALDHLRQKHLAVAEEVSDHVHTVHQRAFNHFDRPLEGVPGFLGVLHDPGVDTLDQGVLDTFRYRGLAPAEVFHAGAAAAAVTVDLGEFQQPLCGVLVAIEDDVLNGVAELGGQLVVHGKLPCIDNTHVHAGTDGVVEKHRVNGFAHHIVAAE